MNNIQVITSTSLKDLLDTNTMDYIATVYTPWHAHGFEAALRNVEKETNTTLKGIVLVMKHVTSGYMLDQAHFEHPDEQVFYYEHTEKAYSQLGQLYREIKGLNSVKHQEGQKPFYVFTPMGPDYYMIYLAAKHFKKRNIIAVVTDEGMASYLRDEKTWKKEFSKNPIKQWYFSVMDKFHNETGVNQLKRKNAFQHKVLFRLDSDTQVLHENKSMAECFSTVVHNCALKQALELPKIENPYVLINTRPYSSESETETAFSVVKGIVEICVKKGLQVVIKPHPREMSIENYERLPITLLKQKGIAQEDLLMRLPKPLLLMGFCSTTEITCNVINEIKTCDVMQILTSTGVMGESPHESALRFSNATKEMVITIKSLTELEELLQSL